MSTIKNYLNIWFEVSPWSYRVAFFALGYSLVSLFIAQEDIIMLEIITNYLDKFYSERPFVFRAFFFLLGFFITSLVMMSKKK